MVSVTIYFALVSKRDVLPGHYGKVSLDDMQLVGAPVYRLSMIAEAYATKGTNKLFFSCLCLFTVIHLQSYIRPRGGSTALLQRDETGSSGLIRNNE